MVNDQRSCDLMVTMAIIASSPLQHDTTLTALLSVLKLYDGVTPAYSSAVMIELFSDPDDEK